MRNASVAKIHYSFYNNKNVLIIVTVDISSTQIQNNVYLNVHKECTMISKVLYGLVNLATHRVKYVLVRMFVTAVKMVIIFMRVVVFLTVQISIFKI